MAYIFKKNYECPDLLASDEEKESEAYGLKYAQYMHNFYKKNGSQDMFYNARVKYQRLVRYAQGDQDIDQYKMRMNVFDTKNDSWVNINWSIRNYATKRVNVAIGMLINEKYDVVFKAIDPLAKNQAKEIKAKAKAYLENKKFIEGLGISTNFLPDELKDKIFNNSDELEVHMNMDYKHRYEMEMEMGVFLCLEANKYEQIKKENAFDLVVLGPAACRVELDSNGFPKLVYVDPQKMVVPLSKHEDYRDIPWAGCMEDLTIHDLRQKAAKQFSDDQYKDINLRYNTENLDDDDCISDIYSMRTTPQSSKIRVMHFSFLSDKEDVYEKTRDNYGNSRFKKIKDPKRGTTDKFADKTNEHGINYRDNGKYQIFRDKYKVVYEGYWIVGSDHVFNYGLKTNMEVAKKNFTDTQLPYHIFAPNLKNGKVVSIMDQMMPKLDDIQHMVLRIQHTIASAVPKGVKINYEALLNANIAGAGGKKLEPFDLIRLYFQRGIVLYADTDASGTPGSSKPIEELENGMANDLVHLMAMLQQELIALDEIIGTNQITSASTPHQDTLKGVAELSVAATNNAFSFLFHAQRSMFKGVAESLARLYVDSIKNGSAKLMAEALGQSSIDFISDNSEASLHEYGIGLEIKPTGGEWDRFYAEVKDSVAKGIITMSDWFFIKRVNNMKQAEEVFKVREMKRAQEEAESKKADVEMNAQVQAQSNDQATKNRIVEIETEGKIKIAVLDKEKEKIVLEHQLKMEELKLQITLQGLVKSGHIQQEGETKLMDTKMKTEGQIFTKIADNATKPEKPEQKKGAQ
jgi:hypothetical protein